MTPTPTDSAGNSGTSCIAGTSYPAQRIEALQSKINSIARKFQLSDQSYEDIAHYMIERLLTKCVEDPNFIARDDGYWLRFANWMGYRLLTRTITYNRVILEGEQISSNTEDAYELYEQAVDLAPKSNPESALDLAEVRQVISHLPSHNRRLAAMLMIGYSKSEIADIIGISRPAISQRLRTIKMNLTPIL